MRLPNFSGATKPLPGEVDYESWRAQLQRVTSDDPTYPLPQVRNSLRGDALSVVDGLTSVKSIIDNLDEFFLDGGDKKQLLQESYGAQQSKGEGSSLYLIRLMGLKKKITSLDSNMRLQLGTDMREVFWKGLADHYIRASLHFKYESGCETTELMKGVRQQENDRAGTKTRTAQVHTQRAESAPSSKPPSVNNPPKKDNEVSELREEVKQLRMALEKLTAAQTTFQVPAGPQPGGSQEVTFSATSVVKMAIFDVIARQLRTQNLYNSDYWNDLSKVTTRETEEGAVKGASRCPEGSSKLQHIEIISHS
jgi:hypothetical protein